MYRKLKPKKKDPSARKFVTFDTEGNGGLDGFACGSVCTGDHTCSFTDPWRMAEFLLSDRFVDHWLIAHNLEYDLGVLWNYGLDQLELAYAGQRLFKAEKRRSNRHKWHFSDSCNFMPGMTLEVMGEMVGVPKDSVPKWMLEHLAWRGQMKDLELEDRARVIEYNKCDSQVLYEAVGRFQEELLSLGAELQDTIAGIGMDLFQRKYLKFPIATLDPDIARYTREAYYGARTECFTLGWWDNVYAYDFNSLYPSLQATEEFPHPNYLKWSDDPQDFRRALEHPGVSQVRVRVPESYLPPLPVTLNHGLYFPYGEWTGWYHHNELRYALEQGVEVIEVGAMFWSTSSFSPFTEFVEDLYRTRKLAASDNPWKEQIYKLLMNSNYGRWGIDWEDGIETLIPIYEDTDLDDPEIKGFHILGPYIYGTKISRPENPPPYANNMFAGQISAAARIKLHQLLLGHQDRLHYCDTDAMIITGETATSEGLGGLRYDWGPGLIRVIQPKEYFYRTGDFVQVAHAKGIPKECSHEYLERGRAEFAQPTHIREALRKGKLPSQWVEKTKRRSKTCPKRMVLGEQWEDVPGEQDPLPQYETRPWEYNDLVEALKTWSSKLTPDPKFLGGEIQRAIKSMEARPD